MPPKFRITRSTAQPKVTIYSSPGDLLNPAAMSPADDRSMARPAEQLQEGVNESTGAASLGGSRLSPVGTGQSLMPASHPDLEDLIASPKVSITCTPRTSVSALPLTPDGAACPESTYTSLRRTTRSATRPTPSSVTRVKVEEDETLIAIASSSTAEQPITPTRPRKRVKRGPITPITPTDQKVKVEGSQDTPGSQPRSAKKAMPLPKLEKPHPAPARWEEQYRLIERMRKGIIAPVDDMGCERPQLGNTTPKMQRFHVLISLMLSSQTKDAITSQAVTNLHVTLPEGLSAESLAAAPAEVVSGCINKVGFWRRKTEYIQDAAKLCLEQHDGEVPNTIEGLCAIRGVGPKMAYLALQCAWEINAGIGVDVHVHRITNRLKWHKPPTQTPEQTRVNLESWLPSNLHRAINPLLVGFGQVICLPVGPRCDLCLLGSAKICPSRVANVKAEGRKEVVYTFTAEGDDEVKTEQVAAKVEIGYEIPHMEIPAPREETPLTSLAPSLPVEGVVKQEIL